MEERYQTELRCRRRRDGESIRELAQDVRRLMSLAYPGQEDSNLGQHIARDSFLTALGDPDLQIKIRERDPRTLEETVRLALRIEVTRAAVDSASTGRHRVTRRVEEPRTDAQETKAKTASSPCREQVETAMPRQPRRSNGLDRQQRAARPGYCSPRRERRSRATSQTENTQLEQLAKKLQEMEVVSRKKDAEMSAKLDLIGKELDRYRHLDQVRTHNAVRPNQSQGQEHPPIRQQGTRFGRGEDNKPTPACWNCDQPGHFARQCPINQHHGPPFPPSAQWTRSSLPQQQGQQRQREFRTSGVSRNNVRSTGHTTGQAATYLRARVDGRERDCLLDSGSKVSILPSSLVLRDQLAATSHTLKAANGSEITVLGKTTVPLVTPWYNTTVTGLVTDHVAEVMLGVDWLTENGADWSFKDSSIYLGGHHHRLSARPMGEKWCRRVIAQEDTVIPARSQQNLPCKVMFHARPSGYEGQQWETEPAALLCGVLVARTLTPPDQYVNVPVRVMNLDEEPKRIRAGTIVSDLEPVTVLESGVSPVHDKMQTVHPVQCNKPEKEVVLEYIRKLVESVDPATPEVITMKLQELLLRYRQTFSESEQDLGLTDIIVHHIDTGSARPVRQQLRKFAPAHMEAITQHVDSMLEQGIIEPACSPWASNVVLVKKGWNIQMLYRLQATQQCYGTRCIPTSARRLMFGRLIWCWVVFDH